MIIKKFLELIFSLTQLGSSEKSAELQQAILPTTIINEVRSKGNQKQLNTNIDKIVKRISSNKTLYLF